MSGYTSQSRGMARPLPQYFVLCIVFVVFFYVLFLSAVLLPLGVYPIAVKYIKSFCEMLRLVF